MKSLTPEQLQQLDELRILIEEVGPWIQRFQAAVSDFHRFRADLDHYGPSELTVVLSRMNVTISEMLLAFRYLNQMSQRIAELTT